jgi:acyl-CoA thioesterase
MLFWARRIKSLNETLKLLERFERNGYTSDASNKQPSKSWGESMNEKIKEAIFKQVEKEPFAEKFNLKLIDLDDGYSKVAMVFTPDMENIFGKAHGGALFALIDEAFETASNSHGTVAVALNMNISYLASPVPGSILTAEAKEMNRTNRTAIYDIKVTEGEHRLLASCQALVYRMDKPLPFLAQE